MHDAAKVHRYLKRARCELHSALLHSRLPSRHYLGNFTNTQSWLSFVTKWQTKWQNHPKKWITAKLTDFQPHVWLDDFTSESHLSSWHYSRVLSTTRSLLRAICMLITCVHAVHTHVQHATPTHPLDVRSSQVTMIRWCDDDCSTELQRVASANFAHTFVQSTTIRSISLSWTCDFTFLVNKSAGFSVPRTCSEVTTPEFTLSKT